MNCRDWEGRLALYMGGDLPGEQAVEVERHLGECPGCQVFSSGLREARELLLEMHRDPVSPAHFAAVRARVLAELERQQRPFWRRGWAFGLAAVAAALLILLAVRPGPTAHRNSSAPLEPVASDRPDTAGVTGTQPAIPAAPHKRRVPAKKEQPGEPVLIRVVSDDPNVVIYWIADTRGD